MNLKLVIFDMDGLMFDTERLTFASWQEACGSRGYCMDRDTYLKIIGLNSCAAQGVLFDHFGKDFPVKQIMDEGVQLTDRFITANGLPVKEGLYELLACLTKSGVKKAVATSTDRARALALLKMAGIDDGFDYVLCGDEIEHSKPHPEIFLKVAAKAGCLPAKCLVLEDSERGILAAHAAGIPVILVPDMKELEPGIQALALKQFANLREVKVFLETSFKLGNQAEFI